MCSNDWNKLSFNERVQCYISKKEEIEAEYKSRLKNGCNFPSLMTIKKYPGSAL